MGGGHTHLCSRLMRSLPWLLEQLLRTRQEWSLSLVSTWMMAWASTSMCSSTVVLTRGLGVEEPHAVSSIPASGWIKPSLLSTSVSWLSLLPSQAPCWVLLVSSTVDFIVSQAQFLDSSPGLNPLPMSVASKLILTSQMSHRHLRFNMYKLNYGSFPESSPLMIFPVLFAGHSMLP